MNPESSADSTLRMGRNVEGSFVGHSLALASVLSASCLFPCTQPALLHDQDPPVFFLRKVPETAHGEHAWMERYTLDYLREGREAV